MEGIDPVAQEAGAGNVRLVFGLVGGGFLAFLGAGLLLWWRDGEQLFTDGLISAIARCF